MLDNYTKNMLWENIYNVYSDSEQLEIINYLIILLKNNQDIYMQKNSIEEVYFKGLEKLLQDIKKLRKEEKNYFFKKGV